MSIEATSLVWSKSKAKGSARLVLLCISNYINKNGVAWPSIKTIAGDTMVSERQVSRAISELEELREIEIVEKGDGRGRSTVYKITIKDDAMSPLPTQPQQIKDDTMSEKGDISSTKDDTMSTKDDTMSSQSLEPLTDNHKEPLKGERPPVNPFPFKPLEKNRQPTAADLRARAIADACGLMMTVPRHKTRCENAAAQLNEFTPEYITERFTSPTGYWRLTDWRGRKGSKPTPEQVIDEISTGVNEPTYQPGNNGTNGHHSKSKTNAELVAEALSDL